MEKIQIIEGLKFIDGPSKEEASDIIYTLTDINYETNTCFVSWVENDQADSVSYMIPTVDELFNILKVWSVVS